MRWFVPVLAIVAAFAACRKADDAPVPRRYAYPRIQTLDSAAVRATCGPLSFDINAAADTAVPAPAWLDVRYPAYGVTVHLSVNSFADGAALSDAVDNRRQRIALNFGDVRPRFDGFSNAAGFECLIAANPEGGRAPMHILAVGPGGRMLSGAAVFAGPTKPVDSVAPVYNAVYADLERLLRSLR